MIFEYNYDNIFSFDKFISFLYFNLLELIIIPYKFLILLFYMFHYELSILFLVTTQTFRRDKILSGSLVLLVLCVYWSSSSTCTPRQSRFHYGDSSQMNKCIMRVLRSYLVYLIGKETDNQRYARSHNIWMVAYSVSSLILMLISLHVMCVYINVMKLRMHGDIQYGDGDKLFTAQNLGAKTILSNIYNIFFFFLP